jgi:hypothetical protein
MKRREFLKQAGATAAAIASTSQLKASATIAGKASAPIAKRTLGRTGERLSLIGFGGIVVMNEEPGVANNIVAEAVDRGVNYFDVAPSYGDAQERLGVALAPYRHNSFLACKTDGRMKDDSRADLEQSLKLLKTDHLDLYQFHALTKMTDLDRCWGRAAQSRRWRLRRRKARFAISASQSTRQRPRWQRWIATPLTRCCFP